MVDLARRMLLHDRARTALTVAGVGFAASLVLIQVGLFLGLLDNATVTIEHLDADIWIAPRNTANVDFATPFPDAYVDRVRSAPGIARADNLVVWFAFVAQPGGARESAMLYALDDFARWTFPWDVTVGDARDLRRGDFILIDESARGRFDAFAAGDFREINGARMKVIGTTRGALSFTTTPLVFVDLRRARMLDPQLDGRTTYVIAKLAPGADGAAAAAELRRRLPYSDVHTKDAWMRRSRTYWLESTGLGMNMYVTIFLGCLVGLMVVAQTLYTSTIEHLREFGTVKAIGGSNRDIFAVIAKQALFAAVLGFAAASVITVALKPLFSSTMGLRLMTPPWFWAAVFAGTLAICLVAALVPYRRIASLDPALVFRA